MSGSSSDRNLLLGIVALQMDFISCDDGRDCVHASMDGWEIEAFERDLGRDWDTRPGRSGPSLD